MAHTTAWVFPIPVSASVTCPLLAASGSWLSISIASAMALGQPPHSVTRDWDRYRRLLISLTMPDHEPEAAFRSLGAGRFAQALNVRGVGPAAASSAFAC